MEAIRDRYGVESKEVMELKEHAARMASMMGAFCGRMGYSDLEVLISRFQVSPLQMSSPLLCEHVNPCSSSTARALCERKGNQGLRSPSQGASRTLHMWLRNPRECHSDRRWQSRCAGQSYKTLVSLCFCANCSCRSALLAQAIH